MARLRHPNAPVRKWVLAMLSVRPRRGRGRLRSVSAGGCPHPQHGADNCTVLRTSLVILLGCGRGRPRSMSERGCPHPQPGANICTVLRTRPVTVLGCGRGRPRSDWLYLFLDCCCSGNSRQWLHRHEQSD